MNFKKTLGHSEKIERTYCAPPDWDLSPLVSRSCVMDDVGMPAAIRYPYAEAMNRQLQ